MRITLIPKADEVNKRKEKYRLISHMKRCEKNPKQNIDKPNPRMCKNQIRLTSVI